MKTIDLEKTMEKCRAHWEAAQNNSNRRFVVFMPVFVGEDYDGKIEGNMTFNASWAQEEVISYDEQGFDGLVRNIDWNDCDTDTLYGMLGSNSALQECSAGEIIDGLEDGLTPMTKIEREAVQKWKAEQIDGELDHWWSEDNAKDSIANYTKEQVFLWAKKMGFEIVE